MMSTDGFTSTTRVASGSTTLLSRRRGLRRFRSFVSKLSGWLSTDPEVRSCLERDGLTSTKVTNTNRSTAVGWSCKNTNVKPTGHFLQPLHHLRHCEVCLFVQQSKSSPMMWDNQLHGLKLLFFYRVMCVGPIFTAAAWRKVFVELPAETRTDKSKVGLFP